MERKGNTIAFTDDEMKMCVAEGGCLQLTKNRLEAELQRAYEAGRRSKVCPGRDI